MEQSSIQPNLSPHRFAQLIEAIAELDESIAQNFIWNARFSECKRVINLAVEEVVQAHCKAAHDWNFDVLVMGATSLPSALAEAERTGAADRAKVLSSLLPLHRLLQSAKPHIVKRGSGAPRKRAASPKKNMMTCQVCALGVAAETGLIALHGYKRPFGGGQTASCDDAGAQPFEASRDRLGHIVDAREERMAAAMTALDDVRNERAPVTVRVRDRSGPFGVHDTIEFKLTRENAVAVLAEVPPDGGIPLTGFDDAMSRDLAFRASRIAGLRSDIAMLRRRHDGWTMTHKWDTEAGSWRMTAPLALQDKYSRDGFPPEPASRRRGKQITTDSFFFVDTIKRVT